MNNSVFNYFLFVRNYFIALSSDKKYFYGSAALVVALILYFLLIVYPLYISIQDVKEENINQENLLRWVEKAAAEISQLKAMVTTTSSHEVASLPSFIEQEAKKNSWSNYASEMKQLENKQVEITFKAISFDDLINGVQDFSRKYNIQVVKISIGRTKNENLVHTNLILK